MSTSILYADDNVEHHRETVWKEYYIIAEMSWLRKILIIPELNTERNEETTLFSVHDHIIKAMSRQQVTCLTHLDQSADWSVQTLAEVSPNTVGFIWNGDNFNCWMDMA